MLPACPGDRYAGSYTTDRVPPYLSAGAPSACEATRFAVQ
jgi:hypothetical protein